MLLMSALVENLSLTVVKFLGFPSCSLTGNYITLCTTKIIFSEFQLTKATLSQVWNTNLWCWKKPAVYSREHERQNPGPPLFRSTIQSSSPTNACCNLSQTVSHQNSRVMRMLLSVSYKKCWRLLRSGIKVEKGFKSPQISFYLALKSPRSDQIDLTIFLMITPHLEKIFGSLKKKN